MNRFETSPPPRLTRRDFMKKAGLLTGGSLAAGSGDYGYARWVEPRWIEIKRLTLSLAGLAPSDGRGSHGAIQRSSSRVSLRCGRSAEAKPSRE
ncbi:twin-arginine translocation signal domain-containing protein [Paenibacillus sp. P25]|nr:twin-arginine translocation signal domain-containing protein [Paenibacillus sp. P25]